MNPLKLFDYFLVFLAVVQISKIIVKAKGEKSYIKKKKNLWTSYFSIEPRYFDMPDINQNK